MATLEAEEKKEVVVKGLPLGGVVIASGEVYRAKEFLAKSSKLQ